MLQLFLMPAWHCRNRILDSFTFIKNLQMEDNQNIKLTLNLSHSDLDAEELDRQVRRLEQELRQMEEVEEVHQVVDPDPMIGSKALGGFLGGLLMTQINPANIAKLFRFLGDRLGGKPIEIEVQSADGRRLVVKAHSRKELQEAVQIARDFLAPPV